MESRYAVRWVRYSGETIRIEDMTDLELVRAHHSLEREDVSDPVAGALLDAIAEEAERRVGVPAGEHREAA
jgi:hypothetical protein